MKDKVALVTGASRGIGAAIGDAMVRQGAHVFGTATTEEGAGQITRRLADLDGRSSGLALNVNDSPAKLVLGTCDKGLSEVSRGLSETYPPPV